MEALSPGGGRVIGRRCPVGSPKIRYRVLKTHEVARWERTAGAAQQGGAANAKVQVGEPGVPQVVHLCPSPPCTDPCVSLLPGPQALWLPVGFCQWEAHTGAGPEGRERSHFCCAYVPS